MAKLPPCSWRGRIVRILDLVSVRLVDFHACAARIGENNFHTFAFKRFDTDEDIAPKHGG